MIGSISDFCEKVSEDTPPVNLNFSISFLGKFWFQLLDSFIAWSLGVVNNWWLLFLSQLSKITCSDLLVFDLVISFKVGVDSNFCFELVLKFHCIPLFCDIFSDTNWFWSISWHWTILVLLESFSWFLVAIISVVISRTSLSIWKMKIKLEYSCKIKAEKYSKFLNQFCFI